MNSRIFFLSLFSLISFSFSAAWHGDDAITEGQKFYRSKSKAPVYIECTKAFTIPQDSSHQEAGYVKRSFAIKIKAEGGEIPQDTKVGVLCVSLYGTCITIAHIEIEEQYRNQGFGTDALNTVLGVYGAQNRSHLLSSFTHYCLTTTEYNSPALRCYEKCGFTVRQSDSNHPAPPGWVYLFKQRSI